MKDSGKVKSAMEIEREKKSDRCKCKPPSRISTPKSEVQKSCIHENLNWKKNPPTCKLDDPHQLIPMPKTPRQPKEVLQRSLIRVKSSQWTESVSALRDIVQVSRFNPQILEKHLPSVYKEIISLMQHTRTAAIRTACQAANEIFINVPPAQGPELENLICVLLQKINETNPLIREDASEALDSFVLQVPSVSSIKILLSKRIAGLNESSRAAASKLLVCAMNALGTDSSSNISNELKIRLVNAAVGFLQDDCFEIKVHGMNLVTIFLQNEAFTNIIQTKFNNPMMKRSKFKSKTGLSGI